MAGEEKSYGVGVSWKTPSGAMVWVFRKEWAEVVEDVTTMFGADAMGRMNLELNEAFPIRPSKQETSNVTALPSASVQEDAPATTEFVQCPACGQAKDKWVPPGVSNKTGKPYRGFWACPTRGCPGR
jgi:hypothetical protein